MDSGILVLDLEGKVMRWNRAMESLYGKRREEALGRPLDEVFPEAFLDALRGQPGARRARGDRPHLQAAPAHRRWARG